MTVKLHKPTIAKALKVLNNKNNSQTSSPFEVNFSEWFDGFPDYKDPNQLYILSNPIYKERIKHPKFYINKIKERVAASILKNLDKNCRYLLATNFDDFTYGIDMIQIKESSFYGIDITTNEHKVFLPTHTHIKPIDFFRNPNVPLTVKKKGIPRKILYFDESALNQTINRLLGSLEKGAILTNMYDIYKTSLTKANITKATSTVAKEIEKIL